MEVSISTSGGIVHAQLKLPRAWVISAVLAVAAFLAHAATTEIRLYDMRVELAQCKAKSNPPMGEGGQQ